MPCSYGQFLVITYSWNNSVTMCMWCDNVYNIFRMVRLHTVYLKIPTRFIFSEVAKYLMQYIGFVLLIKLIASVGMLV